MAEFAETMRKIRELCEAHEGCAGCIMAEGECVICGVTPHDDGLPEDEIERRVAQWEAAKPKYPSWEEAWAKLFPYACEVPCPRKYFDKDCFPIFICAEHDCNRCKALPMHPEIAEKLGIKPKEEHHD